MLQPVLGLQTTGCWSAVSSLHPSPDPIWDLWKREIPFAQYFSKHGNKTVRSCFWILLGCQKEGETGIRESPVEAVIWCTCEVTKACWRSSWALKLIYFKGCQERGHIHTHWEAWCFFLSLHRVRGNYSRNALKNYHAQHWEYQFIIRYIASEVRDH